MRKLTTVLLGGASICLALTIALLIWRVGGGMAAAAAGLSAGIALVVCIQGLVAGRKTTSETQRELALLRNASIAMASALDQINTKLEMMTVTIEDNAVKTSEELTSEVRILEVLVQRMGESLEERLAAKPAGGALVRVQDDQAAALLKTVREALAENRVDLYLQPAVSLPQRRTVFYEGFSRLRDETGNVLMPAQYLTVAEPVGLVTAIDNLLLFRCVQIVRRLARQDRKVGIFCNVSLSSLRDEVFFPQFLDFLGENKDMAGGLIFELGQAAFQSRGPVEARNMAKLADLGFRFSIDKVTDLDLDFRELQRADVSFIKISANVLLEQLLGRDGGVTSKALRDIHPQDFAPLARRYGAEVIAEKIETERQVIDVLELDVGYGQGHLFGEPRAIKDAVLAETDPPVEFLRSSLRRAAGR